MLKFDGRIAMLVTASLALSGCHSIFGGRMAHLQRVKPTPVQTAQATEEGRHFLDQGQLGLAIESFQRALASGDPPAPALNGLGVAFAQLGRFEVAQRLFQQAMAIDPTNERYAANLARLNRSAAFAMRHDGDSAAALQRSAELAQASAPAQQAAAPQPGQLTRVSDHEFHIQTAAPSRAPMRSALTGFKPIIRIEFGSSAKEDAAPPKKVSAALPERAVIPVASRSRPVTRFMLPSAKPLGNVQKGSSDRRSKRGADL